MDRFSSDSECNPNSSPCAFYRTTPTKGHGFSSTRKSFAVDKLEYIKKVGSGSYGLVWSAKYLGDTVAVKRLRSLDGTLDASSYVSQKLAKEVAREALILELKRSRHIVSVLHYSPSKNILVMEFCKNGSMARFLCDPSKQHVVWEWKNRLKWAWQIAQGMNVMHNEPPSILHRDFHPGNIFVTAWDNIRIGDVGCSKQPLTNVDISRTGSMDGHFVVWQPPEVMIGRRYSTKSDVYSFGVIMHQLLMIDGPYGFDLPLEELNEAVKAHVMNGKGLEVPEDRNLIPGVWHPSLERYIDLMYKCCAREPEDRPEFDEVCETLAKVQQEYNEARGVESPKKRFTVESLKRVFVISAMVILSLLTVSGLLEQSRPGRSAETSAVNDTRVFMELLCIRFACVCIFGTLLCVAWQHRRGIRNFLKNQVFKPMNSSFIDLRVWFEKWNLSQEDQSVSWRSPFEYGPGQGSDGSVINLPIPGPELWKEIREAFIAELQGNADTDLQAILAFCQVHENDQLEQPEWEQFVRLSIREPKLTGTDTWRRYQTHLTIPMLYTYEGLSAHDNEHFLDPGHFNAWDMRQLAGFGNGPTTSALQGNELYALRQVRSASFSFDRRGQRETVQQNDLELFTGSLSLGVPAPGNEASEIQVEAEPQ